MKECYYVKGLKIFFLEMVDKTTDEFNSLDNITGGDVQIGCAESYQIKYLAQVIQN